MQRKSYIDVLKAASAIVIMCHHYKFLVQYDLPGQPFPLLGPLRLIYNWGHFAVVLFFLLSGFVLAGQAASAGGERQGFRAFIGKKWSRLYPAFLLTSFLCVILQLFAHFETGSFVTGLGTNLHDIFLDLTMLKSGIVGDAVPLNLPAWFLTPLFFCYCLFWWIFYRKQPAESAGKSFGCIALAMAGAAILYSGWSTALLNMRLGSGLLAFFLGVLLGLFCANLRGSRLPCRAVGLLAVIFSLALMKTGLGGNLYISSAFMFAALVLLLDDSAIVERVANMKAVRQIWQPIYNMSYLLFLSHYPVLTGMAVLNRVIPISQYYDTWWFFGGYLLLSTALAALVKILASPLQRGMQLALNLSGDER